MGFLTEGVEVDVTTSGMPLRVMWKGRAYKVVAEPVRWYERRRWWEEEKRIGEGQGSGVIDHEIWRLQVRLSSRSPIQTFDVSHRVGTDRWRLVCIHSDFLLAAG